MPIDVKSAYDETKPTETPMPRMGLRWRADGTASEWDAESTKAWNDFVKEILALRPQA